MTQPSDWLYATSVHNLVVAEDLPGRLVVGRVEFMRSDRLGRANDRMGSTRLPSSERNSEGHNTRDNRDHDILDPETVSVPFRGLPHTLQDVPHRSHLLQLRTLLGKVGSRVEPIRS